MNTETSDAPEVREETSTALTVQDRAALVLGSSKTEADLILMVAKTTAITKVNSPAGRTECHRAAMAAADARISIAKIGKASREDAQAFSKAVIAEEKRLVSIIEPEEKRLIALRDTWDAIVEAEKAAAAAAEQARVTGIQDRIEAMRASADLAAQARTSAAVERLIDKVNAVTIDDTFAEFVDQATLVKAQTMQRLKEISDAKMEDERERARVKAEQEAEAARLKAEREAFERQQAEAAAAKAKEDAEAKAKLEAEAAELQRQRDAFEAEQAAAKAAIAAQAAELARQREELAPKPDQSNAERSSSAIETVAEMLADDSVTVIPATVMIAAAAELDAAELPITMESVPQPSDPSDADVIWTAAKAVADAYGMTLERAIQRLSDINDWIF